ncbi:MAG: hypothetical protein AcusKO_30230 [Acuticoccus sp.]
MGCNIRTVAVVHWERAMIRLSIDVGGTFTDLVVERSEGAVALFKSPTTYPDPIEGVMAVIGLAADASGATLKDFLSAVGFLFHSTTRAINAVVTEKTARTALLLTEGHPDVLVLREGGRTNAFDYSRPFPAPYIPRSLTFEVPGRIWADGREIAPLDPAGLGRTLDAVRAANVEAVAVSLLWSVVNPAHELAVAAALEDALPGIPYTLSHQLNPTLREYRRTSSTAIDASLKPVMTDYLTALGDRLTAEGLRGRVFAVTSQGGLVALSDMARKPILALNSGPSMAPVAGRRFAERAGPQSAGSTPGPVAYGRGGTRPTVTDAAVVLGYIDPDYFLGGSMALAVDAAREALERDVAIPLGLTVEAAALAILDLATEHMVNAIEDITVKQGIDPSGTVLIAGGGAAGLNTVLIARRLGCAQVIVPDVGAALSAAGAMMSDMVQDFTRTRFMRTTDFDRDAANAVLAELTAEAEAFFASAEGDATGRRIEFLIEARYPSQVWETEVALPVSRFDSQADIAALVAAFHARHVELFSFRDDGDQIEIMSWRAVARARIARPPAARTVEGVAAAPGRRAMTFPGAGAVDAPAYRLASLNGGAIDGPAVVESDFTTVVLQAGTRAMRDGAGHLVIDL